MNIEDFRKTLSDAGELQEAEAYVVQEFGKDLLPLETAQLATVVYSSWVIGSAIKSLTEVVNGVTASAEQT